MSRTEEEIQALVDEYLSKPYERIFVREREGGFSARISELKGCVAQGDTIDEAEVELENAAEAWLYAALELEQAIPEPLAEQQYSGRILIRIPKSLHAEIASAASLDETSLNQFIVATLAERVGRVSTLQSVAKLFEEATEALGGFSIASREASSQLRCVSSAIGELVVEGEWTESGRARTLQLSMEVN